MDIKPVEVAEDNVVEFIPREEYERQLAMDHELQRISGLSHPTVPRDISRKKVVEAFAMAFEMIGGAPRLAVWANENPGEFFKLYGKMLPSSASKSLGEVNELVVKHVLPRSPLDG